MLILIATALIPSCDIAPKGWGGQLRPLTGIRGFPPTDTDYGKGFRDGCNVGWKAVTKGLMADINSATFDSQMLVKNSDYGNGFGDGYDHCVNVMDWDVP